MLAQKYLIATVRVGYYFKLVNEYGLFLAQQYSLLCLFFDNEDI